MPDALTEGSIVAGKYRVERVLGRGGMGVVVAASHVQLGLRVALKILLPEAFEMPEVTERFLREARAVVQIQSEHVARVSDVGTLESGAPYMVMEHLEGSDLGVLLETRGPFSIVDTVDYVLQACEAIAEAHVCGIVHRDLKPANLFLTRRPDGSPLVKVLDFGIAKAAHLDPTTGKPVSMTQTSALMGTPLYLSPEQIRSSRDVDARTDIWSLGIILHELLTGSRVYSAETAPALFAMIVADPPPPLRSKLPQAPAELEAVILRCLEKDRERRYGNVAELAQALARFGSADARASAARISVVLGAKSDAPGGVERKLPGRSSAPTLSQSVGSPAWGYTQASPRRKWKAPAAALALLTLTIAGSVALLHFWRSRPAGNVAADGGPGSPAPAPTPSAVTVVASGSSAPPAVSSLASPAEPPLGSVAAPQPAKAIPKLARAQPKLAAPVASAKKAHPKLDPFDDTR